MKNYLILTFLLSISLNAIISQDVTISIANSTLTGNTWSFDVYANSLPGYTANAANWSTMNVRMDIAAPSGISISFLSATFNSTYASSVGGTNSVPGSPPVGSIEMGITIDRNSNLADLPSTQVYLGSWTFNFSNSIPGSNLATPRPNAVSSGSFYVTYGDALTRRPFNLPTAFPLPISIKSFTAVKDGERSSRLDWTSSSEINSDYIGIERSDDGTEWTTLGQVKAAGNSNTDVEYQYIDRNIPLNRTNNQVYYYRLKLVDLDGRFKYSDIRGVNFDGAKFEALTLYPNPAAQFINVDMSGLDTRDGDISLHIYDMAGKEVLTKPILGAGIEPVEIKHLTGGTYHVMVTQGDTQYHKKFIKID